MGRPFLVEKTLLAGLGDSGCAPDGFCRKFEMAFLAGGVGSPDFRFLFGGREGSDGARLQGVNVLARLLSTSKDGAETEDAGCSSTE
jgi:hypothetical protein